jgi:hypothetical protein
LLLDGVEIASTEIAVVSTVLLTAVAAVLLFLLVACRSRR